MQRKRLDLNAVYISERVQKCLHAIADSALTAVVAPMGYGKTTAVNWFLAEQSRVENALVVRVSIYSENLQVFWKSLQNAFAAAGLTVLDGCDCPQDASGAVMLLDDLCAALQGGRACYLFLDDFHLLQDDRAADFLCALAGRLPDNAHLIVASRNRFVPGREVVRLGRRLHRVETDQLRLNRAELTGYARRCGLELTGEQADALLRSSEGWFSAVYLNFHALAERGALLGGSSDIYAMFTSAMIECLPEQRQEFLAVMGLADEFTVEMARAVTGMPDADQVLKALTEQNAFVSRLPGGEQFRFHHMMKECAEKLFARMPEQRRNTCWKRYGDWYAAEQRYLQALNAYEACGDHDAALAVVEQDAGILLASLEPADLLARLERCPVPVLKQHPAAILVLMRCMFNLRQIPKMLELKELLLASAAEHPEWPEEEKGNLLGECDLILSFLMYNDISAMSRLHRSASTQMSRPAISIQNSGGWTFGSPSVLMMFHRQPGQLEQELAEMDECMPHYYKITSGHGMGAETIMRAEADFLRGRFDDAQIGLERAYAQIAGNGQTNMTLCCDFLAWRLSLGGGYTPRIPLAVRQEEMLRQHNMAWRNLFHAIGAYYYALRGQTDSIPEVYAAHRMDSVNTLAPGRPMIGLIEDQVYLAQGEWTSVLGRAPGLLAMCEALHYDLVALHLRIQMAAAYAGLGRQTEAGALLQQALAQAAPDGFAMPFAENYRYLAGLLEAERSGGQAELAGHICALGRAQEKRCAALNRSEALPEAAAALTDRELRMAGMIARRCTNREIAQAMFLSEGTVKQYINQLYAKLDIGGDVRTRRARLAELFRTKN